MNETPITDVAKALARHYGGAAETATPPPPRFQQRHRRVGLTPLAWGLVAAALVGLLVGAGWIGSRMPTTPAAVVAGLAPRFAPPIPAAPHPVPPRCPEGSLGEQTLPAGCRVSFSSPAMVLSTARESHLLVSADRVTLTQGWVAFDVEHRDEKPLHVDFDGGSVEVLGTEFSLFQDAARGHVELVEGSVRIIESGGETHLLEPGDRYGWTRGQPLPPAQKRPEEPPTSKAGESIDEVARLRSKKAYGQARRLLRRLRARAGSAREREVLDYELGTVLEAEGVPLAERCRHWRGFQTRYPGSRYGDAIAKKLEDCT